jgi:hypothetical protein
MTKLFGEFQSEHVYSEALFKDSKIGPVLRRLRYTQDMAGNRIALYTDPEIVAQLEGLDANHPMRQLLIRSGWGPVLHRGGDTSVDGFQATKRAFERELLEDWIDRSNLSPVDPRYITEEGLKAAIDDLHQYERSVARGEVIYQGRLLGVMGPDVTLADRIAAFAERAGAFNPGVFNNPQEFRGHGIPGTQY